MTVYVGSSLYNAAKVRAIQAKLILMGVQITYDWTRFGPGQLKTEEELADVGHQEELGVRNCDLFFMVHPARNGTHCELGMARALDKHIVILEEIEPPERKTFYYRPKGHNRPIHRFTDEDEAIDFAVELLKGKS
jgi:nucleoside 2-deoxyribosyltransferase